VPGWHAKTKEHVEAGSLQVLGIVQEQHPDRAALFMQWKQMDWPVLADPFNELGVKVVPITLLIDEKGVIRSRNPKDRDLKKFLNSVYSSETSQKRVKLKSVKIDDFEKLKPESAVQHFQLGVAYRKRFDSKERKRGDFTKAIASWKEALALDPNQYIWRRRIQQYGPRLDKPYSFYDWVREAREEILKRGEKPHPLGAEPRGSEFAYPGKSGEKSTASPPHPDPEKKVQTDDGQLLDVRTTVVPSTKGEGRSARVHLCFVPDVEKEVHWTNDAGKLSFHLNENTGLTCHDLSQSKPEAGLLFDREERVIEFEVRVEKGKGLPKTITGNAYYYVCEGVNGTCLYRRKEIEISLN